MFFKSCTEQHNSILAPPKWGAQQVLGSLRPYQDWGAERLASPEFPIAGGLRTPDTSLYYWQTTKVAAPEYRTRHWHNRGAHTRPTFARSTPMWSTLTISISTFHEINHYEINFKWNQLLQNQLNSCNQLSLSYVFGHAWFHWTLQVLSNFSCPERVTDRNWLILVVPKEALTKHCVSRNTQLSGKLKVM